MEIQAKQKQQLCSPQKKNQFITKIKSKSKFKTSSDFQTLKDTNQQDSTQLQSAQTLKYSILTKEARIFQKNIEKLNHAQLIQFIIQMISAAKIQKYYRTNKIQQYKKLINQLNEIVSLQKNQYKQTLQDSYKFIQKLIQDKINLQSHIEKLIKLLYESQASEENSPEKQKWNEKQLQRIISQISFSDHKSFMTLEQEMIKDLSPRDKVVKSGSFYDSRDKKSSFPTFQNMISNDLQEINKNISLLEKNFEEMELQYLNQLQEKKFNQNEIQELDQEYIESSRKESSNKHISSQENLVKLSQQNSQIYHSNSRDDSLNKIKEKCNEIQELGDRLYKQKERKRRNSSKINNENNENAEKNNEKCQIDKEITNIQMKTFIQYNYKIQSLQTKELQIEEHIQDMLQKVNTEQIQEIKEKQVEQLRVKSAKNLKRKSQQCQKEQREQQELKKEQMEQQEKQEQKEKQILQENMEQQEVKVQIEQKDLQLIQLKEKELEIEKALQILNSKRSQNQIINENINDTSEQKANQIEDYDLEQKNNEIDKALEILKRKKESKQRNFKKTNFITIDKAYFKKSHIVNDSHLAISITSQSIRDDSFKKNMFLHSREASNSTQKWYSKFSANYTPIKPKSSYTPIKKTNLPVKKSNYISFKNKQLNQKKTNKKKQLIKKKKSQKQLDKPNYEYFKDHYIKKQNDASIEQEDLQVYSSEYEVELREDEIGFKAMQFIKGLESQRYQKQLIEEKKLQQKMKQEQENGEEVGNSQIEQEIEQVSELEINQEINYVTSDDQFEEGNQIEINQEEQTEIKELLNVQNIFQQNDNIQEIQNNQQLSEIQITEQIVHEQLNDNFTETIQPSYSQSKKTKSIQQNQPSEQQINSNQSKNFQSEKQASAKTKSKIQPLDQIIPIQQEQKPQQKLNNSQGLIDLANSISEEDLIKIRRIFDQIMSLKQNFNDDIKSSQQEVEKQKSKSNNSKQFEDIEKEERIRNYKLMQQHHKKIRALYDKIDQLMNCNKSSTNKECSNNIQDVSSVDNKKQCSEIQEYKQLIYHDNVIESNPNQQNNQSGRSLKREVIDNQRNDIQLSKASKSKTITNNKSLSNQQSSSVQSKNSKPPESRKSKYSEHQQNSISNKQNSISHQPKSSQHQSKKSASYSLDPRDKDQQMTFQQPNSIQNSSETIEQIQNKIDQLQKSIQDQYENENVKSRTNSLNSKNELNYYHKNTKSFDQELKLILDEVQRERNKKRASYQLPKNTFSIDKRFSTLNEIDQIYSNHFPPYQNRNELDKKQMFEKVQQVLEKQDEIDKKFKEIQQKKYDQVIIETDKEYQTTQRSKELNNSKDEIQIKQITEEEEKSDMNKNNNKSFSQQQNISYLENKDEPSNNYQDYQAYQNDELTNQYCDNQQKSSNKFRTESSQNSIQNIQNIQLNTEEYQQIQNKLDSQPNMLQTEEFRQFLETEMKKQKLIQKDQQLKENCYFNESLREYELKEKEIIEEIEEIQNKRNKLNESRLTQSKQNLLTQQSIQQLNDSQRQNHFAQIPLQTSHFSSLQATKKPVQYIPLNFRQNVKSTFVTSKSPNIQRLLDCYSQNQRAHHQLSQNKILDSQKNWKSKSPQQPQQPTIQNKSIAQYEKEQETFQTQQYLNERQHEQELYIKSQQKDQQLQRMRKLSDDLAKQKYDEVLEKIMRLQSQQKQTTKEQYQVNQELIIQEIINLQVIFKNLIHRRDDWLDKLHKLINLIKKDQQL